VRLAESAARKLEAMFHGATLVNPALSSTESV
jgi:hypothetical protein